MVTEVFTFILRQHLGTWDNHKLADWMHPALRCGLSYSIIVWLIVI